MRAASCRQPGPSPCPSLRPLQPMSLPPPLLRKVFPMTGSQIPHCWDSPHISAWVQVERLELHMPAHPDDAAGRGAAADVARVAARATHVQTMAADHAPVATGAHLALHRLCIPVPLAHTSSADASRAILLLQCSI